jgi:hypothetical protein
MREATNAAVAAYDKHTSTTEARLILLQLLLRIYWHNYY